MTIKHFTWVTVEEATLECEGELTYRNGAVSVGDFRVYWRGQIDVTCTLSKSELQRVERALADDYLNSRYEGATA